MNHSNYSLFDLRSLAACLVSLAFRQMYPASLLIGSKVTPLGFYVDVSVPSEFTMDNLSQIDEMIQAWIRQDVDVFLSEMVPQCAQEYFAFHSQPYLAQSLEESSEASHFLLHMHKEKVISESGYVPRLRKLSGFGLQSFEITQERLRLSGTAFFTKLELKNFLKKSKNRSMTSHLVKGEKYQLFSSLGFDGGYVFSEKGTEALGRLKSFFVSMLDSAGFVQVCSSGLLRELNDNNLMETHLEALKIDAYQKKRKVFEVSNFGALPGVDPSCGLLDLSIFQGVIGHVYSSPQDLLSEVISSLHFMTKIFKILGFAFKSVLFQSRKRKGHDPSSLFLNALEQIQGIDLSVEKALNNECRLEFCVEDALGRFWPVAFMAPAQTTSKDLVGFSLSCCMSFERVFALLLEQTKYGLPQVVAPFQICIAFGVESDLTDLAVQSLVESGLRVTQIEAKEEKLGLSKAKQLLSPYFVWIGAAEDKKKQVCLHKLGKPGKHYLKIQELKETLTKSIKQE